MWAQLIAEAVAGSGLAVGMAYGLARHTPPADPTSPPPVPVRGGTPTPRPAAVTGEAFERVWAQAGQVGWHRLLAAGALHPVGAPARDPGNPVGSHLVLAEHVGGAFGDARILLGLNGSPNADGSYELVAIPVPSQFTDPLAAAAWTYDDPDHPVRCTRQVYADTARRT
jgi:hypothetical protein